MGSLEDIQLYNILVERKSHDFLAEINDLYMYANDVLLEIPKLFSNYTFHDIDHSIRVINYMFLLIEDQVKDYSDLHIAMIIMSGLAHDTGMFASDDEIAAVKRKISQEYNIYDEEILLEKCRNYIRIHHGERVKKVIDNNRLSGDKPVKSLFSIGKSYNFGDEISKICQSHMEDVEWIRNNITTKLVLADYVANPQQIAMLLRIADVIDIDDRRAPDYMSTLLNVKGFSKEEWSKHTPVTNYNKIQKDDGVCSIYFSGECKDADIYRKLQKFFYYIESDLKEIKHYAKNYDYPYTFKINDTIINNISTKGFKATKLEFQLDYSKVMTLLMGEKIYGDRKAGLREMIQNSVDAVLAMKERTAGVSFSTYSPLIGIEINKDSNVISLYDNGIGMDRNVLRNYFFKIGNSFYGSEEFRKLNPSYMSIGRYGIGFLSCFMLSQHIVLETKSQDGEAISIEFEKDSPYVTERIINQNIFPEGHGTKISFRYNEVIDDVFENEDSLKEYVSEMFLTKGFHLFVSNGEGKKEISSSLENDSYRNIYNSDVDISIKIPYWPDMIHSVSQLCDDSSNIFYLYDDDEFVRLEYLMESIQDYQFKDEEYDSPSSLGGEQEDVALAIMDLVGGIPGDDLYDAIEKSLLEKSYENGNLVYWRVPIITDLSLLDAFKERAQNAGYDEAIELFRQSISYFYVVGRKQAISNDALIDMANYVCESMDVRGWYAYDKYSDFDVIRAEKIYQRVLRSDIGTYLPIDHNYSFNENNVKEKVYMQGVRVSDEHINLPLIIKNTKIEDIRVNIHSSKYQLNVSRNNLDAQSHELLGKRIAQIIYKKMIEENEMMNHSEDSALIKGLIDELI